jgi:hypothetical protein
MCGLRHDVAFSGRIINLEPRKIGRGCRISEWKATRSGKQPDDFPSQSPPGFAYDQAGGAGAREPPSGDAMIKIVYEEMIIQIDNEELARLLGLEPGFTHMAKADSVG